MAKVPARQGRIWLDEFTLAAFVQSYEQAITQATPDITCLSDDGPRVLPAGYGGNLNFTGLFDGLDNQIDEIIQSFAGDSTTHSLVLIPHGSEAEGSVCYLHIVQITGAPRSGRSGQAVGLNHSWADASGIGRGVVLGAATLSGAGNRTGQNVGATTSGQRLWAAFHLFSFSGTSITINVQESQNDGSPDTYATISGMTSGALSAPGSVVTETTAATEAWKRVNTSGTFSSAVIGVALGVVAAS